MLELCAQMEEKTRWPSNLNVRKGNWCNFICLKGVCQVLLRLEITKPRLPGKPPNRRELSTAAKLANLTEDRHRKSSYSASKLRRLPTRGSTTQVTTGEFTQWWSKDIFSVLLLIQCKGDWCWEYQRGSGSSLRSKRYWIGGARNNVLTAEPLNASGKAD